MRRLAQRAVYFLSLWLGVVLFSFILFHAVPSDPARIMLGANAQETQVAALRKEMGLDRPLVEQFAGYIGSAVRFDLGVSYLDRRPVAEEVGERLQITLALAAVALTFTLVYLAIVIVLEARRRPQIAAVLDFTWSSMPSMFSAVIMALIAVRYWPFTIFSGRLASLEDWLVLLPPGLVLAFYPMAILSRILRKEVGIAREKEYVLAAKARGIPESVILRKHILRNAALPCVAALSNLLPAFFTSTFVVEIVFSLPGLGSLLIRSLLQRDFPMIEGIVIVNGFVIVLAYLVVELAYPVLDPRVRERHV